MKDKNLQKKIVLKLLDSFGEDWSLAPGLKILIETGDLPDSVISLILGLVDDAIKTTKEDNNKQKFIQLRNKLQKLKEMEEEDKEQEQLDLDELLKDL